MGYVYLSNGSRHVACSCKQQCMDVPEEECHHLAVCKGLPLPPRKPLVEIVMVPR